MDESTPGTHEEGVAISLGKGNESSRPTSPVSSTHDSLSNSQPCSKPGSPLPGSLSEAEEQAVRILESVIDNAVNAVSKSESSGEVDQELTNSSDQPVSVTEITSVKSGGDEEEVEQKNNVVLVNAGKNEFRFLSNAILILFFS